jgi:hypothetical protein
MLIVNIGYKKYAINQEALNAILGMCEVEEKRVGNITKFYITKEMDQTDIEIRVVNHTRLVAFDDDEAIEKDTKILLKDEKKQSEQYANWWRTEREKTTKLEAEVKALKELCPESHKKVEENK